MPKKDYKFYFDHFKISTFVGILILFLQGSMCGPEVNESPVVEGAKEKGGIYHSLWEKDTLWQVAEAYDITVKQLARANNLETPFDKVRGDRLFIPGVLRRQFVRYKDPRWNVMRKSLVWPLEGEIIRDWGERSYNDKLEGIDISAPEGTIIKAATSGWVVYEGDDFPPYGKMIIIQHRYVLATVYGCNSENLVRVGTRVDEGEPIAKVGRCRKNDPPYLHFEVVYYANRVDPHEALIMPYEDLMELMNKAKKK